MNTNIGYKYKIWIWIRDKDTDTGNIYPYCLRGEIAPKNYKEREGGLTKNTILKFCN